MPLTNILPEFLRDLGFPTKSLLESRWITLDGHRLHSRSFKCPGNEGPPYVLVHGLVISSLYMIPLAECLAARNPVHALDLPGFGRSEAPSKVLSVPELAESVIGWLDEAGIDQCHLVANSLGCEIVAHVAVKAPERVASLTLVGPTLDPHAFAVTTQTLRLIHDALHEPFRLWLNWIFDFCRAGIRRAIGTMREMFKDRIENQLPLVPHPTLTIRGGKDPTVPQRAAEEMVRLLPNGKLLVIDGEPHCVHYTQPKLICRIIEEHTLGRE